MNKSVDELIGEIRAHARGRVDSAQIGPMLDEVRGHLESSIRARIEMGIAQEKAVDETVSEFGDPVDFARKMTRQHPADRFRLLDRSSTIAMLTGLALYSIFEAVDRSRPVVYPLAFPFLVGAFAIALWIAVTSWRAKLLPIYSIVAVFVIGIPIMANALALSWLPGQPLRLQREKDFAKAQENVSASLRAQDKFAAAANLHFFGMNGAPKLKIIWKRSADERPDTFQLAPAATSTEATATWQKVLPRGYAALDAETQGARRNMSSAAEDLQMSYLQHVISGLPEAVGSSGAITLGTFYLSAFSWLLGYLGRSVRRSRGRQGIVS